MGAEPPRAGNFGGFSALFAQLKCHFRRMPCLLIHTFPFLPRCRLSVAGMHHRLVAKWRWMLLICRYMHIWHAHILSGVELGILTHSERDECNKMPNGTAPVTLQWASPLDFALLYSAPPNWSLLQKETRKPKKKRARDSAPNLAHLWSGLSTYGTTYSSNYGAYAS